MPKDGPIRIQPNKTALVILDMQNFFLHESIIPDPHGRAIVREYRAWTRTCVDETTG